MEKKGQEVPRALRIWFTIHFAADILFALPLLIAPVAFLSALGWNVVDPLTARMVAAALFGIGTESLLSRNSSKESFRTMLRLKIIWSAAALTGLLIGLISGLFGIWLVGVSLFLIFFLFNILWIYWFVRLK